MRKFHHVLLRLYFWQCHSKTYAVLNVGITAGVSVSRSLLVVSAAL